VLWRSDDLGITGWDHDKGQVVGDEGQVFAYTRKLIDDRRYGRLPPGLELKEEGYLSGRPEESGMFPLTLKVAGEDGDADEKRFELTVSPER